MTTTVLLILVRLVRAAGELTKALETAIAKTEQLANETRELLTAVRELGGPMRDVCVRFHRLGARAADLSAAVLDELEGPVLTSVAVMHGVRTGTKRFMELFARRMVGRMSSKNGDTTDE
jgi:hypothetical protein